MHHDLAAIAGLGTGALGERVVWVASTHASARRAFKRSAQLVEPGLPLTTRGSVGSERIEFDSGGSIRFVSAQGLGVRGLGGDLVLVDESVRARVPDFYSNQLPYLLAPQGRVMTVNGT